MEAKHGWLRRRIEGSLQTAFLGAYRSVGVSPASFLQHLRDAHQLPVRDFRDMFTLPTDVVDQLAEATLRGGMKLAAAEGAGFGLGGMLTLVPDMGVLAVVTMRTIQKLSLVYGFEYRTDDEVGELWIAAATAAGVDVGKDLLERHLVSEMVPRIIQRIAAKASAEAVEKWAGRVIPVVSSIIGAGLNYYFVRSWGRRAQRHFRERHLQCRAAMQEIQPPVVEGRAHTRALSSSG